MNIHSFHDIIFFVLFFMPGFIMLKVYSLLVAVEKTNFSSSLFEVIAFSCLNYAISLPALICIVQYDWLNNYFILFVASLFIIILIMPIIIVKFYIYFMNSKWAAKNNVLSVNRSAWDDFFSKNEYKWVIVNLKNGNKIGGKYKEGSFASSYPCKDIFISEVWKLTENGIHKEKVNRTAGILVLESEISNIEFFN